MVTWWSLQFAFRHFLFSNPPKYTLGWGGGGGVRANIVYYGRKWTISRCMKIACYEWSLLKWTRFWTEKKFLRCWAMALQYKFLTPISSCRLRSKTPSLELPIKFGPREKFISKLKDFKYKRLTPLPFGLEILYFPRPLLPFGPQLEPQNSQTHSLLEIRNHH